MSTFSPETSVRVVALDAEYPHLRGVEAPPRAPVDAAAGQVVEQRHLFRQTKRVVEGGEADAGPDPQFAGDVGGVHAHDVHRRAHAVGGEVVFGEPDGIVPGTVHDPNPVQRPVVDGCQRHAATGPTEELEDGELHGRESLSETLRRKQALPRGGLKPRQSINRWRMAKVLFSLAIAHSSLACRRIGTHPGHTLPTDLCTRYPPHLAANSWKTCLRRLAPGAGRSRFRSTDLDTAQTQTAFRRREGRQTGPGSDALQPEGAGGLQGLGGSTERRQPGSGDEQSAAWYRRPEPAGFELESDGGSPPRSLVTQDATAKRGDVERRRKITTCKSAVLRPPTGERRGSEPGPSSGGTRILTLIQRSPVARRGFFFVVPQPSLLDGRPSLRLNQVFRKALRNALERLAYSRDALAQQQTVAYRHRFLPQPEPPQHPVRVRGSRRQVRR